MINSECVADLSIGSVCCYDRYHTSSRYPFFFDHSLDDCLQAQRPCVIHAPRCRRSSSGSFSQCPYVPQLSRCSQWKVFPSRLRGRYDARPLRSRARRCQLVSNQPVGPHHTSPWCRPSYALRSGTCNLFPSTPSPRTLQTLGRFLYSFATSASPSAKSPHLFARARTWISCWALSSGEI